MRSKTFSVLIFFALFSGLIFAQSSAELKVDVLDKIDHVISDVLIFANYQEILDGNLVNKNVSGATNNGGAFETTLYFSQNATPASHMFIQAYHPYWSSNFVRARVPTEDEQIIISQRFKAPIEFETYRVRVSNDKGVALSSINVEMFYPFFVSKPTELNGIAQFRFPKGITPYGRVEYNGEYELFTFDLDEKTNFISTFYPFENPIPLKSNKKYSLDLQMLDSTNQVLARQPVIVSSDFSNATYFTDLQGNLRARDIPSQNITLYWQLYDYTYSQPYNLEDALPQKLISDRLLKIHTPSILHLGESCYRVEVNITDPRADALKQVVAKALDGDKTIAITLEQNQTYNQSQISFNRIFCVVDDTTFDIVASSPYENTSLTIKLLKTPEPDLTKPVKQPDIIEPISQGIPDHIKNQQEEARKVELLVILLELLSFFAMMYLVLKFRIYVIYYIQSIVRFTYTYLEPIFKKKDKGDT